MSTVTCLFWETSHLPQGVSKIRSHETSKASIGEKNKSERLHFTTLFQKQL